MPDAASLAALDPASLVAEYDRHAAAKEARIAGLAEEAGLGGLFRGMLRCPVERGFRMRTSFYFTGDGGSAVGVDPRGARVPLEDSLWVIPGPARSLVREVAARLEAVSAEARITGFEVRLEFGGGRAHLTLAAERGTPVCLEPLCGALMAEVDGILGVAVPSQGIEAGEIELRHELLGKTILAHHRAFFQTNRWLTEPLAADAREAARDPSRIVDLYCGVGLHSLLASREDSVVLGVDNNRWAIGSATQNAALHRIPHARYLCSAVERVTLSASEVRPGVVFVNPSRFGCSPGVAERVAGWRPGAVCLVSCSIESHLRDLASFMLVGYRPGPFRSFDMFPFSGFVESVSELLPD